MTLYTITQPQPSAIFPNGGQGELAVYNRGPSTVFVGATTSVSRATGYELPALSSLRWRAGRPLFISTNSMQSCTVSVEPNVIPGDISRANIYQKLIPTIMFDTGNGYNVNPSLQYKFDEQTTIIETSSFSTLQINFSVLPSPSTPTHVLPSFQFIWFDADGSYISRDAYAIWVSDDVALPTRVTIPVRGYYLRIYSPSFVNRTTATSVPMIIDVYGLTTTLPQSWRNGRGYYPLANTTAGQVTSTEKHFTAIDFATTNREVLYFSQATGDRLSIVLHYVNAAFAMGTSIFLFNPQTANTNYSEIYSPPMTETLRISDIPVPRNTVTAIRHTALTAGSCALSAVWSD